MPLPYTLKFSLNNPNKNNNQTKQNSPTTKPKLNKLCNAAPPPKKKYKNKRVVAKQSTVLWNRKLPIQTSCQKMMRTQRKVFG